MISNKINVAKCYLTTAFKPTLSLSFPFLFGKDRDEHTIPKKWGFFDEIYNSKSFNSCLMSVITPIKEPIIVTVCINIIFNNEIVLIIFFIIFIGSADIPILKIGIDSIYILSSIIVGDIGRF